MQSAPTQAGLFRAYALPVFWLFALPALALWFAGHAESLFDARFLEAIEPQIQDDASLTAEQRVEALEFYRSLPPSLACNDQRAELAGYRENLGEACSDVRQFGWIRALALGSLGLGGVSLVFALACALASFVSRPMQYLSFVLGWNVLKVVGALQTVLQGVTAVLLSYWMSALWMQRYFPKLILIIACLAAFAAFNVVRAIFRKPDSGLDVEGELITETDAPAFWARLRAICADLNTPAPAHVVAGIDDNFFVSEGELRVGDKRLSGRSLYVSLAMLRVLSRSEAEAVLAHEMAHFSGGDTEHSKRLSPMIARFTQYLGALYEGGITRPIFHFMAGYYSLFALSLSRSGREREFAADAQAAKLVSSSDMARALVKIGAYASYRGRVEEKLFEHDERHAKLGIADRVVQGFAGYATTEALHFDLHESVTPHPFDSHPPLNERLKNVGSTLERAQYGTVLLAPPAASWLDSIGSASEIELRLWTAYESRFAAAHEMVLAYRYEPANDVERAHVEKYFPALTFQGKDGPNVELDFAQLVHGEWDGPLPFAQIASLSLKTQLFKKYLDLELAGGMFKGKRSICLDKIETPDVLVEAIARYHGRYQQMSEQRAAA